MTSSHPANSFLCKVLIVDDENRDWAQPMKDALDLAAQRAGMAGLEVQIANFGDDAKLRMAARHFHVVSLDMRLPERANEIVSVDTGLKLAQEFPYLGFPKYLIYSQTLSETHYPGRWEDTDAVLRLTADVYAKPSGTNAHDQDGVPVLSVRAWAERVVDYMNPRHLKMPAFSGSTAETLTVIGTYLQKGPALLPPTLSREVAQVAAHWQDDEPHPASIYRLVASAIQMAVAQSAVLCQVDDLPVNLPQGATASAGVAALKAMSPLLSSWNWSNYLGDAALDVFTRVAANETLSPKEWLVALQHALDISAYWVRHPLCSKLRYSRDGWTGQLLLGTALPRHRKLLPAAQDFLPAEGSNDLWQSVWRIGPGAAPQPRVVSWSSLLQRDAVTDTRWWLLLHATTPNQTSWMDIDTGVVLQR